MSVTCALRARTLLRNSRFLSAKYFTQTHEWVETTDSGKVRVGISQYAREQAGEIVFLNVDHTVGSEISAGASLAEFETTKVSEEVYAPIDGKVTAVNEAVLETINADAGPLRYFQPIPSSHVLLGHHLFPFTSEGAGWIVELEATFDPASFLDAAAYKKFVDEAH